MLERIALNAKLGKTNVRYLRANADDFQWLTELGYKVVAMSEFVSDQKGASNRVSGVRISWGK